MSPQAKAFGDVGTSATPPTSVLIIGAGVFGLSTADALLGDVRYKYTTLTLLDAYLPPGSAANDAAAPALEVAATLPTASLDSSRIVRGDYATAAYTTLAATAEDRWQRGWPRTVPEHTAPYNHRSRSALPDDDDDPLYHRTGLILAAHAHGGNARGPAYVAASLANVQHRHGAADPGIVPLADATAIRAALDGTTDATGPAAAADAALGDIGYLNVHSGWVDASGALAGLQTRVWERAAHRTSGGGAAFVWRQGCALQLQYAMAADATWRVTGAVLADGTAVTAALVIVAAGAWSAALLPRSLGPRLRAAGQPLAYVPLSAEERALLAGRPTLLNLGSALFTIPPPPRPAMAGRESPAVAARRSMLKVAHHGWGYGRQVAVTDTEPTVGPAAEDDGSGGSGSGSGGDRTVVVSIPPTDRAAGAAPIPPRSRRDLEAFLASVYPKLAGRPFAATRMCWYADTPSCDFLVDYVPAYGRSCMVATGGSGHAFKFAPVLGMRVLQRLEGRLGTTDALGCELSALWRWRSDAEVQAAWREPGDGSRGGECGLLWEEEMKGVDGWEAWTKADVTA